MIILSLNKNLLIRSTDLTARDRVFDFFDDISRSDTIKVVVIVSSPEKSGSEEYIDFYSKRVGMILRRQGFQDSRIQV